MKNIHFLFASLIALSLFLTSCSSEGDFSGREYMPDMAHSIAYEANYHAYYRYNTWGDEADLYKMSMPRKPVEGTIPRGATGMGSGRADVARHLEGIPSNGYVPYYYEDSDSARTLATNDKTLTNPLEINAKNIAEGKELYDVYCGICHGDKGDGNGYLVREDGGKYPAAPANYLQDKFINECDGLYYHAIMHGKGMMKSHSDKLSYKERWQVIHYIRALQAKFQKKDYLKDGATHPCAANSKSLESLPELEKGGEENSEKKDEKEQG